MIELQISQQFARIGLQINDAQYDLNQKKPDLQIKQSPAQLDLEVTQPDLRVDYTPMLESLGLGSIAFITRNFVNETQQQYLVDIEKQIQVGDQMGAIENGLSIGKIIDQSLQPQDSEIELVSLSPIDITYQPATIKSQAQLGGVDMNFSFGKISAENFVFPSIKGFMEQEAYLKIESVGQVFDKSK